MELENMIIERIDHLGLVASVIHDLGIINIVNEHIPTDPQENISAGEVVAGMILNGLGFVSRPLMLTPQFFENKPLKVLFRRKDIHYSDFNRHKIGREFDNIAAFGCDKLFSIIASRVCVQEGIAMDFGHSDTTTFTLTGEYDDQTDTEEVQITHGYAKNKRFDLKQIILETLSSKDGGIPYMCKIFSGNKSDSVILRERVTLVMDDFRKTGPRCIVADSKLYASKTAPALNLINFVTRVPANIAKEQDVINEALSLPNSWQGHPDGYKTQEFSVDTFGLDDQRFIVVYSEQARNRAEKTLEKIAAKEQKEIEKTIRSLQSRSFNCEKDAYLTVEKESKRWKYHEVSEATTESNKENSEKRKGRPAKERYKLKVRFSFNQKAFDQTLNQRSCFVLATNVPRFTQYEVLTNYKGQAVAEGGYAFLKHPQFFTSSLNLEKIGRIQATLIIMVLSLLVYTVAQRRLRISLAAAKETIPNQINQPITKPTLRWVFQLFEGINIVILNINGEKKVVVEGLNDLRCKILKLFSRSAQTMYGMFDEQEFIEPIFSG